jgi:hypothetical protein
MKKSELVATIIFRIMIGTFWAFILYKLPPLTPKMAVILLLMSTVILGYACGGDWLAIKLFKALTGYTIGGPSTQSQNSANPAAPDTASTRKAAPHVPHWFTILAFMMVMVLAYLKYQAL